MNKPAIYTSRTAIICYHILIWAAWFFLPYYLQSNLEPQHMQPSPELMQEFARATGRPFHKPPNRKLFFRISIVENILFVLLFYFNAYRLIPSMLYKKLTGRYIITLASCWLLVVVIAFMLRFWITGERIFFPGPRFTFAFMGLFIIAASISYRFIVDKIKSDQLQKDKENMTLKTELSFLRSQISPHFLFNVLNNMVSLARKQSKELEPSLIKLSGLMRYMLYEANADKVSLSREIAYLESYIDLQEQRFSGQIAVDLQIHCNNPNALIEPMLLIPFVENAFKHVNTLQPGSAIVIKLVEKSQGLSLVVGNNYRVNGIEIKDNSSGIGLNNVKRRLDLLYGENYHLTINNADEKFVVELKLKLI